MSKLHTGWSAASFDCVLNDLPFPRSQFSRRTLATTLPPAAHRPPQDRFDEAAADLVRASLRPGLDPQAKAHMQELLNVAMGNLAEYRQSEAKEAAENAVLEARMSAEAKAAVETVRIKAAAEADYGHFEAGLFAALVHAVDLPNDAGVGWSGIDSGGGSGAPTGNGKGPAAADAPSASFKISRKLPEEGGDVSEVTMRAIARLRPGEDAAVAAARFCRAHRLVGDVKALLYVSYVLCFV